MFLSVRKYGDMTVRFALLVAGFGCVSKRLRAYMKTHIFMRLLNFIMKKNLILIMIRGVPK